jgi:hypothetical protein
LISRTTERFRRTFQQLPQQVQQQARAAYQLFRHDPAHPSLRFKPVHPSKPIFSARVGRDYRAIAVREGERVIWFWIGSHAEYDQLLKRL